MKREGERERKRERKWRCTKWGWGWRDEWRSFTLNVTQIFCRFNETKRIQFTSFFSVLLSPSLSLYLLLLIDIPCSLILSPSCKGKRRSRNEIATEFLSTWVVLAHVCVLNPPSSTTLSLSLSNVCPSLMKDIFRFVPMKMRKRERGENMWKESREQDDFLKCFPNSMIRMRGVSHCDDEEDKMMRMKRERVNREQE